MLQSLIDITDEEIEKIAHSSVGTLQNLASNIDGVKNVLGINPYNTNKTAFQKAVTIYPELLNDVFVKNKLRDVKDSLVKHFKGGKLKVNGKYTFILPDLYAACEYWFLNNSSPNGLLNDGEVFCWLYRKAEKLDCLRSPHLFCEHAVRENIACNSYEDRQQQIRKWFDTKAVYTSCHDLISKILQFDVDGDKALVVADKTIISVAERNIKKYDIVPLYYEMKKALPSQINNEQIYQSLILAFTSAPIGLFSNNISKIWNSDIVVNGTYDEQRHAIDCIKRLCCQNNFVIDAAKTLYVPEFPRQIKKDIQEFTKQLLPHYFVYAKDKLEEQVRDTNGTFVNKLHDLIPNPRIRCKYTLPTGKQKALARPDYRLLMTDPDLEIDKDNVVIQTYNQKAALYGYKISAISDRVESGHVPREVLYKSKIRQDVFYGKAISKVKRDLSECGYSDIEIADILVKYLYNIKDSKNKDLLWACYGEILYDNLKDRVKAPTKEVQCIDCGEWFEVPMKNNRACRCSNCQHEIDNEKTRKRMQKYRENNDVTLSNEV